MGLKSALSKLDDAVKDLTSLHVQTFSGELSSTIDDCLFKPLKGEIFYRKTQ